MDAIGPIQPISAGKHQYALLLVDAYSRRTECVALKDLTAKATAQALLEIFSRTSIPKILASDNGSNFTSQLMNEFRKKLGITPRFTTPMHSSGAGLIERTVQNFKKCLHHVIAKYGSAWHTHIPFILWSLHEMKSATTGVSPMCMLFGKQCRGPLTVLKEQWSGETSLTSVRPKSVTQYLLELDEKLKVASDIAKDTCEITQNAYAFQYNKRAKHKKFDVGDTVLVFERTSNNKLTSEWLAPCTVLEQTAENSYLILFPDKSRKVRHANSLKRFVSQTQSVGVVNNHLLSSVMSNTDLSTNSVLHSDTNMSANVNVIGVIEDKDTVNFGEIIEVPFFSCETENVNFGEIVKNQNTNLSVEQRKQLVTLLEKHRLVFSDKPGLCKIGEHKIDLVENATVPKAKMYPIPFCYRTEVAAQIKSLLEQDIIEPSNSPYSHPIVCIRKKDDTLRLAIDYRSLNSVTKTDSFPMANSNELLLTVGNAKYITSLDACQGFFQVNLADDGSRERSAFATTSGLYQFKRMSFGLRSASETFQRIMNELLKNDREYASAFIDDIAVFSDNWELHLEHLDIVLSRIYNAGLTLKLAKARFAQESIKFLGFLIGSGQHTPDPEKFDAISKLVFPKSKKQMRSFVGLVNFYRQYIPHLSEIIRCLTDMTKRSHPTILKPTTEHIEAFDLAKHKLITPPVLKCPDFSKDFIIQCDASNYCVGACLA